MDERFSDIQASVFIYSHYFLSGLYSYEQEEIENVDGDEEVEIPNLKRQRVGRVSTGGKAPRKFH